MGAGASTTGAAYSADSKAALMKELDSSYVELSENQAVSDVELYTQISHKVDKWKKTQVSGAVLGEKEPTDVTKQGEVEAHTEAVEAVEGKKGEESAEVASSSVAAEKAEETKAETKVADATPQPPVITRMDSVADHPVIAVEETGTGPESDEEDEGARDKLNSSAYLTEFDTGAATLSNTRYVRMCVRVRVSLSLSPSCLFLTHSLTLFPSPSLPHFLTHTQHGAAERHGRRARSTRLEDCRLSGCTERRKYTNFQILAIPYPTSNLCAKDCSRSRATVA